MFPKQVPDFFIAKLLPNVLERTNVRLLTLLKYCIEKKVATNSCTLQPLQSLGYNESRVEVYEHECMMRT